ncbi:DNA-methyltransferase [Phyllobacterium zundukense]|uniref:Methyltransferase n=1 Tax=Phyllobacterium zundukense TaxID=1867719 RepID=A0A2N9VUU1_9HYPH|nr:site-specific DNA-methyltransferase [Phyllobacterium zundukense]ATU95287.1 site-specific DNA-methyltransferase [Phyllobacterium zundukense]PIO43259.1 site-specific DNA-methyltransferase [Phyllobacterium zundukense]
MDVNGAGDLTENLPHRLIEGDAFDALDLIDDNSCRLIITSPPYNIGKEYERDQKRSLNEYLEWLRPIVSKITDKVTDDGHVCWQVGNYVNNGEVFPLDYYFYEMFTSAGFKLRNRIIWHFNFGLHAMKRFSGRYETMLWFTRSDDYFFQLEPVLVPQIYPGKRHSRSKGAKAGTPSGNPKGKNPSDFWTFSPSEAFVDSPIWELPNVKANHPEKTIHPCPFPSELVERCILALTETGDNVLDPFVGTGTSVIAADKHKRIGIGIDQSAAYVDLAKERLENHKSGRLFTRPMGRPVRRPKEGEGVATVPAEWLTEAAE